MPVLFHASTIKNLPELIVKPTKSNNIYIGDYVFATGNIKLCLMYFVPKGVDTMFSSQTKPESLLICSTYTKYKGLDMGGSIYTVDSKKFVQSPQKGLEQYEKVSTENVKILNETHYASIFDVAKQMKVNIYFVNRKQFETLVKTKNEHLVIPILKPFQK